MVGLGVGLQAIPGPDGPCGLHSHCLLCGRQIGHRPALISHPALIRRHPVALHREFRLRSARALLRQETTMSTFAAPHRESRTGVLLVVVYPASVLKTFLILLCCSSSFGFSVDRLFPLLLFVFQVMTSC